MPALEPIGAYRRARMPIVTGLAIAAFSVLVIGAPQLLGGVYPWGMVTTALAGVVSLGLVLAGDPYARLPLSPLVAAMFLTLLWTALQGAPLPCGFIEHLPTDSAEELRRTHRLLGLPPPAWCTITRDPGATREEIVKGIAIVSGFLSALLLSRRGYRRSVYRAIAASGVVLALVAVAHTALGMERVFDVYEPVEVRHTTGLSPLLNPNSAGGFLAMCTPLLMALALSERELPARLGLGFASAFVAGAALMTRSRGAIGALVVGIALLMLIARIRRERPRRNPRERAALRLERFGVPAAIAAGLGLAAYAWYGEVMREFEVGNWDKLDVIATGARFALENVWIGVGRGAFGATFAAFYNTQHRFEYAENFVVQWISEWGAPVALALLAALGLALARALRRVRSLDRMGGLAGVIAIALQNLVEIGFELVGLATVAAALLGATVANREARTVAARLRQPYGLAVPAVMAAALALLWLPIQRDHRFYLEQQLGQRLAGGDRAAFRATLQQALLAHPSEPMFAVFAATDALRARDPAAGRWINRALQLVPGWPAPHLQAAQWLLRAGHRKQGLLELSIAASLGVWDSRSLLCPFAQSDLETVATVRPKKLDRRRFLHLLAHCFRSDAPQAVELDALILTEFPNDPIASLRVGRRALAAGDAEAALAAAKAASSLGQAAHLLEGRALSALGRKREALAALSRAEALGGRDTKQAMEEQARVLAALGDRPGVAEAIARLRGRAGSNPGDLAYVFFVEAALESQMGNPGAALAAYEAAYGITGDAKALQAIASTADRVGDRRRAAWAYGQLCDLRPDDAAACSRKTQILGRTVGEHEGQAVQPIPR